MEAHKICLFVPLPTGHALSQSPEQSLVVSGFWRACVCVCVYALTDTHTHTPVWLFIQEHNSGMGLLLLTQMKGNLYRGEIPAYP